MSGLIASAPSLPVEAVAVGMEKESPYSESYSKRDYEDNQRDRESEGNDITQDIIVKEYGQVNDQEIKLRGIMDSKHNTHWRIDGPSLQQIDVNKNYNREHENILIPRKKACYVCSEQRSRTSLKYVIGVLILVLVIIIILMAIVISNDNKTETTDTDTNIHPLAVKKALNRRNKIPPPLPATTTSQFKAKHHYQPQYSQFQAQPQKQIHAIMPPNYGNGNTPPYDSIVARLEYEALNSAGVPFNNVSTPSLHSPSMPTWPSPNYNQIVANMENSALQSLGVM